MTPEEYNARVKNLLPTLIKKGGADALETTELFLLYNDRFLPRMTNKSCLSCRQHVFKVMVKYYEEINGSGN